MQPTQQLAHQVARDFAHTIADYPEVASLYFTLEDETIVLWLELNPIQESGEVETQLHGQAALTNDRYPDIYVELRILKPSRSYIFDPKRILPQDAERVAIQEVMSESNGAEDARPH